MMNITFSEVYKAVKNQEDENGCPLVIAGVWLNTDGFGGLDVEKTGGTSGILDNTEELLDYLKGNNIAEEFTTQFNTYYK